MPPKPSPEPRPRRSGALLLATLLVLAGLLWAGRTELPAQVARWTGAGARADLALDYARLAPALDSAALAHQLGGLPLHCQAQGEASVCEAALARANGIPAAALRARFQNGRLQSLDLLLPWWEHHHAVGMLTERLGAPAGNEAVADGGQPLAALRWSLPAGTVQIARAPGWNPLRWATVRWDAAAQNRLAW